MSPWKTIKHDYKILYQDFICDINNNKTKTAATTKLHTTERQTKLFFITIKSIASILF
jgi:hypothetical protein